MDMLPIIVNGAALLICLVVMVGSFFSKTIVYGRMLGARPQKITWLDRISLFLLGSSGVYQFAVAILKEEHVRINPSWYSLGLPLSKAVMLASLLPITVVVLIASLRDSLLAQKAGTRIQGIISICLILIFVYLVWGETPTIVSKALTLYHGVCGR